MTINPHEYIPQHCHNAKQAMQIAEQFNIGICNVVDLLEYEDQQRIYKELQTVYPEIVSYLKKAVGNEECKQFLRELGASAAQTVSEHWLPKGKKIQDMVKEIFKKVLDNKDIKIVKEKGSIRYYSKPGWKRLIRVDYHGSKEVPSGTCHSILKAGGLK